MAYYLVTAKPKHDLITELTNRLKQDVFLQLKPFGAALTKSLRNAKIQDDDYAIWEEGRRRLLFAAISPGARRRAGSFF